MIFLICIIPLLIPFVVKHYYPKDVSWKELTLSSVASCLIAVIVYYSSMYAELSDVQIISGQVIEKKSYDSSCNHSYKCPPCRTSSYKCGKSTCYRTVCNTCYEHRFDRNWLIKSDIENFEIPRVDRQGLTEPPRFTQAYIGEPVASTMYYDNYVKGAKDSLFNLNQYQDLGNMPIYPSEVFDYYKINRVVNLGTNVKTEPYNQLIAEKLKTLGKAKEVNVVLVFSNQSYKDSLKLKTAWLGGKKNDVVVVIGLKDETLQWTNVFSWSKTPMVEVGIKTDLSELSSIEPNQVVNIITDNIQKHYVRREMKEFEYLKDSIEPSTTAIVIAIILSITISIGLSILSIKYDIF